MQKLPFGISSFRKIREQNLLYVDKTKAIYELIDRISYIFLARPRGFGKSLLVSTLDELFQGNRDLFKGLWIDTDADYSWTKHPVINISFGGMTYKTAECFEKHLTKALDTIATSYNIDLSMQDDYILKLKALVYELSKLNPVVILIDEYDYPLLCTLDKPEVAKELHTLLVIFFATIKDLDKHLRAVFVTGVSAFSKTATFSGMNTITNVSLRTITATLTGYTQGEIEKYFAQHLSDLSKELSLPYAELLVKTKEWYNGFRFSSKDITTYNPRSFLEHLETQSFTNFWFTLNTPRFLFNTMDADTLLNTLLSKNVARVEDFSNYTVDHISTPILLYQTGYLTIKDYDPETELYALDTPNKEVDEALKKNLLTNLINTSASQITSIITDFSNALKTYNLELFFTLLKSYFSKIPYHLIKHEEAYYHTIFQALATLLPLTSGSEILTDKGRIDLVIETQKYVYAFEIKIDVLATVAIAQIEDRKYYEPYILKKKKVILVGISFMKKERGLTFDHHVKELT